MNSVWRNPYATPASSPRFHPAQRCYVFVTIERGGEFVDIVRWSSMSGIASIRRSAKAAYPGCQLQFGKAIWITP